MALAEFSTRGLGRLFGRTPQTEAPTNTVNADLPACPDSEGDILTGADVSVVEPQPLVVRIVGSRNQFTGEIANYHQEVHGTTYMVAPLTEGTAVIVS